MPKTSPSVPRKRTIVTGPLYSVWPNGVSASLPAVSVTAALNVSQETTPVSATPMAM